MRPAVVVLLVAGCTGEAEPTLSIDGPVQVRVETLGPVDGPRFVGPDGTTPEAIVIVVEPAYVGRVKDHQVVAIGRGTAVVTGEWNGATASWELVVDPAVALSFDKPPSVLEVGDSQPLNVKATIGGEPAIPVDLEWNVKPDGILDVQVGTVVALSPGTAWVTVRHGESEAMLELSVVEARPANADVPETP